MKKIFLFPLIIVTLILLCGCNDTVKLEFDTTEKVKAGISNALSKSYKHVTIPQNIKINMPESINIFKPNSSDFILNENDTKLTETIRLLYDPDDFDKTKNLTDEITVMSINTDSSDPTYQFFNDTKDEHCAISKNGYIHLGTDEILNAEVIECEYTDNVKDNEKYQKAIAVAEGKMNEAVKLQNNLPAKPYLISTIRSQSGHDYYMIYFCRTIGDVKIIPFGTEDATNFDISQEGKSSRRWFNSPLYVCVDQDYNACAIHIFGISNAEKAEVVEKIPTLDYVLNYISKELAPNLNIEIRNISFMYGTDSVDKKIYPVWYIEFSNRKAQSPDAADHNRLIINASNGLITTFIEKTCEERDGTG